MKEVQASTGPTTHDIATFLTSPSHTYLHSVGKNFLSSYCKAGVKDLSPAFRESCGVYREEKRQSYYNVRDEITGEAQVL